MKLYEINDDFKAWEELVEELYSTCEDEGRVPTDEEMATLLSFKKENEKNLDTKYENIVKFIKNSQSDANELDIEIKRLQKKKKAKDNLVDRLKNYLDFDMKSKNITKKEVGHFKLRIQANPPSLEITGDVPEQWLVPQEPKVDTMGIKQAIKDGAKFDWCELISSESIRIS